ncbi:MAG: hypothetical protein IT513_07800 [Burkholderiales bacterium]|nr:hypothetical protein [Burkholderiales bacterium]
MTLPLAMFLGFGALGLFGAFAFTVWGLAIDSDPFRLGLAPLWMLSLVFGVLSVRVLFVAVRFLFAGGLWRLDDAGVTNVKDRIGPIAWADVRGAVIRDLPTVPHAGPRRGLFVEVPDAAARRYLQPATFSERHSKHASAQGLTAILVIDSPPATHPQLEELLAQIRARAGLAG